MRRPERDAGRLPPWLPGIASKGHGPVRARRPVSPEPETRSSDAPSPVCSARGCRAEAAWVLAWNNPRIHTPVRRKTWTACPDHRGSLGDFLAARGFLRDVVPLADWKTPPESREPAGPAGS